MVQTGRLTEDERRRLDDRHETLLRSMVTLRGDSLTPAQLGRIVERATGAATSKEARDEAPIAAVNRLEQFLKETVEADAKKRPTNIYSADAARAERDRDAPVRKTGIDADRLEQSLFFRQKQQDAAVESSAAADRTSSGARYDSIGSQDWSSLAGLAKMRDFAIQKGLPWAANNPELLRLGPAAIGTLAEVHFKQETYKRLTGDASFKAKDVVTLAHFAKEQHVDANKLGTASADAEKPLSPQEREKLNGAVVPYMADPKNPAKRASATKAVDEAAQAHPENRPAFERWKGLLQLKGAQLNRENKAANEKDKRAATKDERAVQKDTRAVAEASRTIGKENKANDKLAALDGLAAEPAGKPADTLKDEKPKTSPQTTTPQPAKTQPKAAAPAPHKLG